MPLKLVIAYIFRYNFILWRFLFCFLYNNEFILVWFINILPEAVVGDLTDSEDSLDDSDNCLADSENCLIDSGNCLEVSKVSENVCLCLFFGCSENNKHMIRFAIFKKN